MSDGFAVQLYDGDAEFDDSAGGLTQFAAEHFASGGVTDASTGQGCRLTIALIQR
jgi:hypothetical protein